jgi:S-adenosylmethionine decarboxylase
MVGLRATAGRCLNMSDDAALCEAAGLKRSAAVSAQYVYSGPELPHGAASGLDHFVVRNGVACAGIHLIIDLIGADHLDDIELIDRTLRECVRTAGATLLHMHLHHFTPNSGVSGVAVLAESHLSIHTWPERGYAALDVFMCGDARPELCVGVLKRVFRPREVRLTEHLRGEGA